MLVLLSGPSGVGKSHLVNLAESARNITPLIATTTRPARPSEIEGYSYNFVPVPEFQDGVVRGKFTDWDFFLGSYYGYSQQLAERALAGVPTVVPVIARMALRLRVKFPNSRTLYLDGAEEVTSSRLSKRQLSNDDMQRRIIQDQEERQHSSMFDVVVHEGASMTDADLLQHLDFIFRRA